MINKTYGIWVRDPSIIPRERKKSVAIIRDYAATLATAVKNGFGDTSSRDKPEKYPFFITKIVLCKP